MFNAGKRVSMPSSLRILRPGEDQPEPEKRQIETDPRAIAAWFSKHVRG